MLKIIQKYKKALLTSVPILLIVYGILRIFENLNVTSKDVILNFIDPVIIVLLSFWTIISFSIFEVYKRKIRDKDDELLKTKTKYDLVKASFEESVYKFEELIQILIDFGRKAFREHEFLEEALGHIIYSSKNFDYGFIIVCEKDKISFAVNKGVTNSFILSKVYDYCSNSKNKDILELFIDNKVMVLDLKFRDKNVGVMILGTNDNKGLTYEDRKLAQVYAIIISAFLHIRHFNKLEGKLHKSVVLSLVKALEYYDINTRGHSERVAMLATAFADYLGMEKDKIRKLYWASLLHDIGKIFIPRSILNKSDRLTPQEFEKIKHHPIKSYEIISQTEGIEDIANIVKYHHERWDGRGYPEGLKEEEIPYSSRILSIVDSYDAMISKRPYRKPLTREAALKEIEKNKGTQFDPFLVEKFLEMMENSILFENVE